MRARAVIGASYGDEGKGRTVEWLAAPHASAALVVRSNGGAQAGHTVETADGRRHVFHHFGSGTLRGARTHLSRFMVSHPIVFAEENVVLRRLGAAPVISADPRGVVTTPWDMMVNQAAELARDGMRHGSCGLGFGETVGRCEESDHALMLSDLHGPRLRQRLLAIREEWLPRRLDEMDLPARTGPLAFARSDRLLDRFVEQCASFARSIDLRDDADIGSEDEVIFEGAQGLLLDQNAAGFPFVTRSNTGLANIGAIAAEAGIGGLEVAFVSRCYLTRHGRGPMEDERPIERWYSVEDQTNRPNPWQESLRFGLLDPHRLGKRVAADLAGVQIDCHAGLTLTCLDHAQNIFAWLDEEQVIEGTQREFLNFVETAAGLPNPTTFSSPVNEFAAIKMQKVFSMAK
jgi:adenylosuccinate synthase